MQVKQKTLNNGLRVVLIPMKDTQAVTVMSLVGTGSFYEDKTSNGLSHFLEHMCFKGTQKRPTAMDISHELDSIGASYNAFTSVEHTGYYAKAQSKKFDQILDIVSDIYLNSAFPEPEIEKEKGVIVQEIKMYKDLPQRHVGEVWARLLYGDQPAGWSIAGTEDIVTKFSRDNFVKYKDKHYSTKNTVIVISGNFDTKTAFKKVENLFKDAKVGSDTNQSRTKNLIQKTPQLLIENKKTDQVHMIIGVKGFKREDKNLRILRVLNAVLGDGMSSRLFQKMREELGICYYVRSDYDAFKHHGDFGISAGVDIKRVDIATVAILEEMRKLSKNLVDEKELKKAKSSLIGGLYLSLETSDSFADFYGSREILNLPFKTPKDIEKEINSVTAEEIQKLAQKMFVNENLNCAVVGDVKESQIKDNLSF